MRDSTPWGMVANSSPRGTRTRRAFVKAAAGGTAGVTLAGCVETMDAIVGSDDDADSITIGLLAPQPASNYIGRSMAQAAALAVEELNEGGGIDGRPVELVIGDTNASPTEARRQYQRLILEEGADVTVGVFDSAALMNIMDDIAEQETIHLTAGSATTAASQRVSEEYEKYKYHFRVGPTNNYDLVRTQIEFLNDMAGEIGWESVALLAEDYQWTGDQWDLYRAGVAGTGVDIAFAERYPPATDDFSDLYEEVADAGTDVALIAAAHTGSEAVLDWSHPNRPDPQPQPQPFAFGGLHVPMQLPTYYEETDGACRYGFAFTSAVAKSEYEGGTQEFVRAYQDRYDGAEPVYAGYHVYDGISLFGHVVERVGSLDTEELIAELEGVSYSAVAGTLEFRDPDDEFAHDLEHLEGNALCFQWQENDSGEGSQEVIWPDEHVTSEYRSPPWL